MLNQFTSVTSCATTTKYFPPTKYVLIGLNKRFVCRLQPQQIYGVLLQEGFIRHGDSVYKRVERIERPTQTVYVYQQISKVEECHYWADTLYFGE